MICKAKKLYHKYMMKIKNDASYCQHAPNAEFYQFQLKLSFYMSARSLAKRKWLEIRGSSPRSVSRSLVKQTKRLQSLSMVSKEEPRAARSAHLIFSLRV